VFEGVQELQRSGHGKASIYVSFLEVYLDQVRDLSKAATALQDEVSLLAAIGAKPCLKPCRAELVQALRHARNHNHSRTCNL
jgi:hypothetical protein